MPLNDFPLRPYVAVSDIDVAAAFYEGQLGLPLVRSAPSADIESGGRLYESDGKPSLMVYQSTTAGMSQATMATWFVEDIEAVIDELAARGVDFVRYDALDHDERGITARAGGGRIAWFRDPDGNTFALESDD